MTTIAGCSQPDPAVGYGISARVSGNPRSNAFGSGGSASSHAGGSAATAGVGAVGGDTGTGGADANAPMVGLQNQAWNWVPFEGAHCRNGSSTGIGVNPNQASDKLIILLEGGGACFDANACHINNSAYGETQFDKFAVDVQFGGGAGVFDRNDAANPVKDWNFVYIPYCTGDVHAGNNPQGAIDTLGPQQFVGYANMSLYLQRIVSTFPGVTQVLLTGVSAGGFGALANYVQVARKFDTIPVLLLDDSGPPMDAPYVPACLANLYSQTWGLDKTVQVDCGSDCPDTSPLLIDCLTHVSRGYPNIPFGLVDSIGDWVISAFFGYGGSDCTSFALLSEATFAAGLQDIKAQMAGQSNFGAFVFSGNDHTTLLDASKFDSRVAADTKLTDYIARLLAGQVSNVGP